MLAVYRKELRTYRTQMLGYVFAAFLLAVIGLYFSYMNLNIASPKFETVLQKIQFVFIVFVPILTMRVMAEEKRSRTDQLLLTLPLRIWQIVGGKFLGLVTVYALPMFVVCLYPLILCRYGQVNLSTAYLSILGFFLLGCADLAIGLFCSSITESPVISAVLTFGILLFCSLMDTIAKMVPYTALGSVAAFAVVLLLLALALYGLVHHLWAVLGFGIVCELVLAALYRMLSPGAFEGAFQKVLSAFYLNGRLNNFFEGILDLPAAVYYLSVMGLALFLTGQTLEKRRWS